MTRNPGPGLRSQLGDNRSYAGGLATRWLDADLVELAGVFHEERLINFFTLQYWLTVELGTPPQTLQVLVDTGSSDLWVRSASFHVKDSSTAKDHGGRVTITYGQGSVSGGLVDDTFRIGGVDIMHQSFLVPSLERGMASVRADGVLGMAMPGLSHTGQTVMQHLQKANISTFSLFLSSWVQSYLVLGEADEEWYDHDQIVWVPAVTGMWWAFQATVSVASVRLAYGSFLLDSGTSFIGAPPPLYETLLNRLLPVREQKRCVMQNSLMVCPCEVSDSTSPMEIGAGNRIFSVQPAELYGRLFNDPADTQCVLQLMKLKPGIPFILGDTFLRTVAAFFDLGSGPNATPSIGLAPLRGPRAVPTPAPPAAPSAAPSSTAEPGHSPQLLVGFFVLLGLFVWRNCRRRGLSTHARTLLETEAAKDEGSAHVPYCQL